MHIHFNATCVTQRGDKKRMFQSVSKEKNVFMIHNRLWQSHRCHELNTISQNIINRTKCSHQWILFFRCAGTKHFKTSIGVMYETIKHFFTWRIYIVCKLPFDMLLRDLFKYVLNTNHSYWQILIGAVFCVSIWAAWCWTSSTLTCNFCLCVWGVLFYFFVRIEIMHVQVGWVLT